ncbi:MAG: hypothetical protein Q8R30_04070 [bacterium]|nr:hypothetical protein [bacterium]MDZ4286111.1 hypothetical protein [Candidatus Sungbacteria bacterium]
MNFEEGITICSVYHSPETKRLLELNYDLVKALNPEMPIRWVVGDNTPPDMKEKIDPRKFIVVSGAGELKGIYGRRGSYRHAHALRNTIDRISTRFALVLDIDFYIVAHEWMQEIPRYMREHDLAFFGVPWHPDFLWKWRYFPSPHTLFVDMSKIPAADLDFVPDYDLARLWLPRWRNFFLKNFIPFGLRKRLGINTSRDTGYKIYKKYFGASLYACAQPVVEKRENSSFLLPERLSIVPKRAGYLTQVRFSDLGYPDCMGEGWEEFMWKEKPYGFHIRGSDKLQDDLEGNIVRIRSMLDQFRIKNNI